MRAVRCQAKVSIIKPLSPTLSKTYASITMASLVSPQTVMGPSPGQPTKEKRIRYFDMLESDDSRERVTVLTTRYRHLLPTEKRAFLQELIGGGETVSAEANELLERVMAREDALNVIHTDAVHCTSTRLVAVQARDPAFICVADELPARVAASKSVRPSVSAVGERKNLSHSEKISEILGERGLFGDTAVRLQMERASMYDRIQSSKNSRTSAADAIAAGPTATPTYFADADVHTAQHLSAHHSLPAGATPSQLPTSSSPPLPPAFDTASLSVADAPDHRPPALHRSHAYQMLRLAHSFPHHINTSSNSDDHVPTAPVANLSGIPIAEDDLRKWFNMLDTDGTGYLSYQEFVAWMRCLEREFGVQETYAQLEEDGVRLCQDNRLGFEAFAYLVLRFVRA